MYFKHFPKTDYILPNGYSYRVTDISKYVNVDTSLIDETSYYQFYDILDGERPDVVSTKLYGIPDHYWTFFLINDSLKNGYDNWPMSYNELQTHLEYEYGGVAIQTSENFWEYDHFGLNSEMTIEGKESVTGIVSKINYDLNQIIMNVTSDVFDWIDSEGSSIVPSNYSSSTPRLTIQKATEHRFGISHYEDANENIVPVSYGVNYNFNDSTDGTIYNPNQILYPITIEQNLIKINEQNSKILVIRDSLINQFYENFKESINA